MAKLLYSATMSVDGFIAGPGGDMSWLSEHVGEKNETADRLLEQIGAIVCGAVTFFGDDPNRGTDAEGAFGGQYDGPVVLLTHRPPQPPPEGLVVATDLESAVATAKEMAGDKYVNILGANVARQCIEQQLLDENSRLHSAGSAGRWGAVVRPSGRTRSANGTAFTGNRIVVPGGLLRLLQAAKEQVTDERRILLGTDVSSCETPHEEGVGDTCRQVRRRADER